ncbi:MAG: hypothetical protein WC339_04520, partial [Candidatus Izemoplasmatales bacterium]
HMMPQETTSASIESDLHLRSKIGRNIGVEIGDICPICLEGTVEEFGGCHTCTNCNAQLKCDI